MTAKIIQFERPKKQTKKSKTALEIQAELVKFKSNFDIFQEVSDDVMSAWSTAASIDKLNEFIIKHLPTSIKIKNGVSYLSDLNELAAIEKALGMRVACFFPGCTRHNEHGWLAAFHRGQEIFSCPPHMASEPAARALNIVLFVNLEKTLKSLGRS